MRSLLQRHRLGDGMIVIVGLLVAAAIAALLGFAIFVSKQIDQNSVERERDVTRHALAALVSRMQHDLSLYARWDEALNRIMFKYDPNWLSQQYCKRLRDNGGHDRSFILNDAGDPIFSCLYGSHVDNEHYYRIRQAIEPLAISVQQTYLREVRVRAVSETILERETNPEPAFRGMFRRIEDKPAVVGITTLVTGAGYASGMGFTPVIAVSVSLLDEEILRQLASEASVNEISISNNPEPRSGQAAVEIPLGPEEELGAWLVWKPRQPGAAMLEGLMPALVAIAALIGLLTAVALVYLRRTTAQLVESERRATELAYRDTLTGLPNRLQLLDTLEQRLKQVSADRRLALLLIDIDGFKDINDTLGHWVGDELLAIVGERLEATVGSKSLTVRLGGDEFALVVPIGPNPDEALVTCRRISEALRLPVSAGDHVLSIGTTIGVAIAPDDANKSEDLLRRSDIALYRAKVNERGGFCLFDPSFEESLHKRRGIEQDLVRAIENDELMVKFQPLYAADGERLVGVEALVRWNHPERGVVPPSEFVPVAELSDLILRLDEWVLRRACEQAAQWPGLVLAVNLSPSNFTQPNVTQRISRVLKQTGFEPQRLEIEITETMLLGATSDVLSGLAELRRLGVRIALDDFGTGYSSLGYLRRFPVDKIKIDKSFVQNLGVTEDAAAIVECLARLGRALGLAVTAEGVETREQHRFVRAAGCHQVQGYLFSPAIEAERITEMMQPLQPETASDASIRLAIV